ncbi:MAG: gamma-glutamyltransferase family protein [Rhodobacter sp.]|uniref:gamma-glutamyltransferase family protein n=1 Tax=Pararhodobacter sp. TaxID=2127056 RepID=UPI001D64B3A2|nr:gamma-glutamyltransferase family protein [Pararhodobacter sp.]MCB1343717.1 gamma-glutamyltransferase family protein [Paracoccaceae bacterium]MCC0074512.1 gamma-glutamyltransferase family protein [Rhodobacter sp.]HPD91880.1 gamma-glutamyltransferase family protein [Pararhodobacter sp.]
MRDFQKPGRSAVYADNGMVATSHPLAAQTAIRLLQDGGNAVDAAIGAAVLLGLCEPQMTGLGGDLFALIKPAGDERIVALNGSGRAPAALDVEAMRALGPSVPVYGVEAVTLPGAVDAFCRLNADWGMLDLAQTLAPAIHYFDAGVPVAPRVARDWAEAGHLQHEARRHFLPGGTAPRAGDRFALPGQAEVLRRIARDGRAGFYEGEVAEDMVATLQALGGAHTLDDFAAVACDYSEPVSGQYRGHELIEHAPNGQGATALLLLNILSHFDLGAMDPFGAERTHLEAEATRLAYDARNRFLADADHVTRLAHMLAPDTAARLAALIDMDRAMAQVQPLSEQVHKDTIYITVVDRDRMAVSLIYSVFHSFGSGLASARFGIGFQNRGAGFTLETGHPNEAAGGKRPMHTIIPGMLRHEGRLTMPFGVMGGAYQPCGHARLVSNLVDYGLGPQAAIDAPRAFAGLFSGQDGLALETGYDSGTFAALAAKGHRMRWSAEPLGGAQAITLDSRGVLIGASDPRKDGCALGY